MNTEQQKIDQSLAIQVEFFQLRWLGAEISREQLVKESDENWAFYMKMFKRELEKMGAGDRVDLITSKGKVYEFWKQKRSVLLLSLNDSACKLHRFDGGKDEPCGYIIMKNGKPFRWLTWRINRPDPSVGNLELPFP